MINFAVVTDNLVSNIPLVAVTALFIKKWINRLDETDKQNQIKVDSVARELADNLKASIIEQKATAKTLADDLKATVIEHRTELKESAAHLETHLDQIYGQLRIANGRTAKLEGGLLVIEKVCDERHKDNKVVAKC